ncbi:uncharacterized protein LOC124198012 isoform X3 [Daphnia pulex]|uniref:uncharacterized protein LOC124198012 isoform X3 n=1 Tax=Daphnia pulex TaxID=6669 RepID=UPI001EDE9177|nr:uncharacterized protein LOC124198012 isoform X3 [Daphnia pulex]
MTHWQHWIGFSIESEGLATLAVHENQWPIDPWRHINSTCNEHADLRGPHQKVIAYSLYGNLTQPNVNRRYLKPLVETAETILRVYPGWNIRIYHNLTSHDESWRLFRKTFQEAGSHIDLCNATQIIQDHKLGKIFSMTWRWLPLLDDLVDTFMSRDADSPIIRREEDAVREWLSGDRIFHVMRDHPKHCVSILGGLWGVKLDHERFKITNAAKRMLKKNHLHTYDYDQTLLSRHIWPIARTNVVAHDSYCCQYFPPARPFPTLRIGGGFVGMVGDLPANDNSTAAECPQQCRPKNASSEWRYC